MAILDAMADLYMLDMGENTPFRRLPLRNLTPDNIADGVTMDQNSLVMINAVVVLDRASDTAANMSPEPSIPIPDPAPIPPPRRSKSGSLNDTGLGILALTAVIGRRRFFYGGR